MEDLGYGAVYNALELCLAKTAKSGKDHTSTNFLAECK